MIQDIAPHTYHNEYRPSQPDKDSFILVYEKGSILLPRQEREEAISFPRFQELEGKTENLYSNYIYHIRFFHHSVFQKSSSYDLCLVTYP